MTTVSFRIKHFNETGRRSARKWENLKVVHPEGVEPSTF
jgi:hypothetical protein